MDERLKLTREISRSGIAAVWEGYDSGLDRKVLVKSIHPQFARDKDLRMRFEREARAIARISHPNVVQIYDLRTNDDQLQLLLEFVEGKTLGKLLKERDHFPVALAVKILSDILLGLEQAHAAGIVHRDLKPENILISKRGDAKITDFGLASLRDQPTVTQEGMVIGTPSYMAPEQALGSEVTNRTDLFTCGLMLFEMLTGKRAIEGSSVGEAFQNVMNYRSPNLEAYADMIPPELRPVLTKFLERDPQRRFVSAAEARAALLKSQIDGLLPTGLVADFLSGEEPHAYATERALSSRRWNRRILYLLGGILAVMLIYFLMDLSKEMVAEKVQPSDSVRVDTNKIVNADISTRTMVPLTNETTKPETSARVPDSTIAVRTFPNRPDKPEIRTGATGLLDVRSTPWARVYIGDSLIGTTPLQAPLKLTAGSQTLVFLNPEINQPILRSVSVDPDTTQILDVNLYDNVARIRVASVRPWADLYVDGEFVVRTPSAKTLYRPLGSHNIVLKNPDYPEYSQDVIFKAGDPIHEIRVDLTQM